jgi:predicted ATPase
MLRTLCERLADEPHTPLSHYCTPHHTASAFYPVIDLLERAAQLDRDAPAEAQLTKLEAVLAGTREGLDEAVPLLAALLGVPAAARYPALTLAPEVQKRRTLQALLDQLAELAARQPVLALYEDVHWIDPSTLELLGMVIERIQKLPVLALITFRPEFQPAWIGQAHVTTLAMSRLGRPQGADLVAGAAGDKPLPAAIVEQIVARTDGVPLFVEELTKTVLESGLLADAGDHFELAGPLPPLAIPETLQSDPEGPSALRTGAASEWSAATPRNTAPLTARSAQEDRRVDTRFAAGIAKSGHGLIPAVPRYRPPRLLPCPNRTSRFRLRLPGGLLHL